MIIPFLSNIKDPYSCRMEDECLPLDIISNLPSSITQTILTFMPIRDAFRTSVLSRKWRYHCANIPKLEFNDQLLRGSDKHKLLLDIYTVLLLHHCPVLEFSLCFSKLPSCCEIDQIIRHLSRNTALEKFTLCLQSGFAHKLPSCFFSLQNLTHLKLQKCAIHPLASFAGFGRLTSLCFYDVTITKSTLLWFLSCCPVIKNFTLIEDNACFLGTGCSDFSDLFQRLPLIEHLQMNRHPVELFALGVIPEKFPAIAHLNSLGLFGLSFAKKVDLWSVHLLITRSPNIKKLKLEMCSYNPREVMSEVAKYFFNLRSYAYMSWDHLRGLEITNFTGMKPEIDFVKIILDRSPMLEKVGLVFDKKIGLEKRFAALEELLELPRASSRAKIIVGR